LLSPQKPCRTSANNLEEAACKQVLQGAAPPASFSLGDVMDMDMDIF
jgi:hypothetical protein